MDDYRTDDLLNNVEHRQAFYSAMCALLTRADNTYENSQNLAIDDMVKVGHMLHYLDPHDRVELFDDIRRRMA